MKILVPIDGSPQSDLAVDKAASIAPGGATVYLLTVAEEIHLSALGPMLGGEPGQSSVLRLPSLEETAAMLERSAKRLRERQIEPVLLQETGDPADCIIRAAERLGVDVVVMGPQGKGAVQRFLLGSVTERVARHAPCSVLVVR